MPLTLIMPANESDHNKSSIIKFIGKFIYACVCFMIGHLVLRISRYFSSLIARRVDTSENRARVEDMYNQIRNHDFGQLQKFE